MKNKYKAVIICSVIIFLTLSFYVLIPLTVSNSEKNDSDLEDGKNEEGINLIKISEFVLDTDTESNVMFSRVRDLVATFNHEENRIAWVNEDTHQIIVTNINGEYLYNFGKRGRGPEEFLEITSLGFDQDDNIIVYDSRQDLFKIFNDKGEFNDVYDGVLEDGIWPRSRRLFIYEDQLLIGIQEQDKSGDHNFWESKTVAVYNSDFEFQKLIGEFDTDLFGEQSLYSYPLVTMDLNTGQIFTSHAKLPKIQVFDASSGDNLARFGHVPPSFSIPSDPAKITDPIPVRRQKNLDQSFVGESFVSDNYFFLQYFNLTEDQLAMGDTFLRDAFLSIYEIEKPFNYIGEVQLNGKVPLHVASDGIIYLMKDNNPDNITIGTYRIDI